jgi:hypothetical protein
VTGRGTLFAVPVGFDGQQPTKSCRRRVLAGLETLPTIILAQYGVPTARRLLDAAAPRWL